MTDKPFGVNIMLMSPYADEIAKVIVEEKVKVVTTGAGSPEKYMQMWKEADVKVIPVVASVALAKRMERCHADAVVAEGFEAGGHNGREETTTLTLIPQVRRATGLPVVAAGGIGSGEAMLAAMALGAEGVQIGTLFALSTESSASEAFKQRCLTLDEGGTMLCLKKLSPTRLVRNGLFDKVAEAEARGANSEELRDILGKAASKRGIFEGDTEQGELEIGQIVSSVDAIRPAGDIVRQLVEDFRKAQKEVAAIGF